MRYLNKHNIAVPMAVFLCHDDYDHSDEPWTISATTLLKSTKEIILTSRIEPSENEVEISTLIPSRIGSAIHDAIERAWLGNPQESLRLLGYPSRVVDRVQVNPSDEELTEDSFPIYLEQRASKKVGKWTVSGKFDMIFNGQVQDYKSTGVYTYINKTNDKQYVQQLSLYRWLNPTKIVEPVGKINYIFKDWNKNQALSSKGNYPRFPVMDYEIQLQEVSTTDSLVRDKLRHLDNCWDKDEVDLPLCTPEELWQGPTQYKYYGKPDAMKASKVFVNLYEANNHLATKGKGYIKTVEATPTKCLYCPALGKCSQGQGYIASGVLKID